MVDLSPSLAPSDYASDEAYRREAEHVLARGWLPVCRVDQLTSTGDRFAIELLGRPVVAVRDGDDVRVLSNVCPHRGSTVADAGFGDGSTLICPYHRWSFRLDGSLIGAPLADDVELGDACLTELRHATWEGFVLVNLSGDADEPHAALAGLSETIAPWRWSEMVTIASESFASTWNWKVMVENWIECYHHVGTHRSSVEPFQPARGTRIVANDGAPWAAMTVDSIDGVAGPPEAWMPGVDTTNAHHLSVWSAFPLLLGGSMSQYGFWLHVVPDGALHHDVTWHLVVHRDHLDRFTEEHTREIMDMLIEVHREDMAACQRVQSGLASGLLGEFRLTPLESTIADFQRFVAAATPPA